MKALRWVIGSFVLALAIAAAPSLAQQPPSLAPVSDMTVDEGTTVTQTLTATDPDMHGVHFEKVTGPPFMIVETVEPGLGTGTGQIVLAPGFADVCTNAPASVRATDGVLRGNVRTFLISVCHVNRPPAAKPGGPYRGVPMVPVAFDGTASVDPDGEALQFLWQFGDQATGTGPTPAHAYAAQGIYVVTLTVSDGVLSSNAGTVVTIRDVLLARAFPARSEHLLRLGSGKPTCSLQVEPVARSYDNADVDPGSLRMTIVWKDAVAELPGEVERSGATSDTDRNGVSEIAASFERAELRTVFSNVTGVARVPVTVEGRLLDGATFRAETALLVQGPKAGPVVSIRPNPLNALGVITVETPVPGTVEARIFDAKGSLVRTLEVHGVTGSGARELAFDGKDEGGSPLASGIYYLRVVTTEGSMTRTFAIVK